MHQFTPFFFTTILAAGIVGHVCGSETAPQSVKTAEYKRSDANFYSKTDVLKVHSSATVLPAGSSTQKDDSYFVTPHRKAAREIYLETRNDWIEPITPPEGAAAVAMPPDAMQIRELQGDVQVALPAAPANFTPVTEGMTLPNGAVLKTGANGTAAVLFGGVDSARLMPNSEAAVQQTVTAQTRSAEVDLTAGGVFSKVGTQIGIKGQYEVHTPFANAVAHGTDFATVVLPARTDVWIAQGTVTVEQPDSKTAESKTSDGTGDLKVIHFPQISDPRLALTADAESLTAALNFISLANEKIKALREKEASGTTLTANEQSYLDRIKQVPSLIKLALVTPPTPPPVAEMKPAPTSLTAPTGLAPIRAVVRSDGKINFQGATYELSAFKSELEAMVRATPDRSVLIRAGKTVPYEKLKPVFDVCRDANVKYSSNATAAPVNPSTAEAATETSTTNLPAPGLLMHPTTETHTTAENPPTTNAPAAASP